MSKKYSPYLFLAFLVALLLFIVGFRWGQNVEKTNKKIDFVLKLPTYTPAPTHPASTYQTYTHKNCRISFLLSSVTTKGEESTTSASFQEAGQNSISFSCQKGSGSPQPTGTEQVAFQNKKINITKDKGEVQFSLRHPQTNQTLFFTVSSAFFPLLEKSLEMK